MSVEEAKAYYERCCDEHAVAADTARLLDAKRANAYALMQAEIKRDKFDAANEATREQIRRESGCNVVDSYPG